MFSHHRAVTLINSTMCINLPFCAAVKSSPVTWAKKQNCDSKLPDSLHVPRLLTNPSLAYSARHVRQTHGPSTQAGIVFAAKPEPISATFYANSATHLARYLHWIANSGHLKLNRKRSLPGSRHRLTHSRPSPANSGHILFDSKRASPDSEHSNSNFKLCFANFNPSLANPKHLLNNFKVYLIRLDSQSVAPA